MPITNKDRRKLEHKKAEAAGTRVPVNPNGTPKKAPKEVSACKFCFKTLARDNKKQMEDHAGTHSEAWTKEKCFPQDF